MATVPLSTWYDDVVAQAPGVPLALALKAIRSASIEFCKGSKAWRYLGLTPIDSVAAQQAYALGPAAIAGTVPTDAVVAHIFQVNWCGCELDAVTLADFKAKSETWYSDQGTPCCWTGFDEASISLYQIPSAVAVGAIVVPEVALSPSEDATTVDASIFQRYREAIGKGALSKLYLMKGKPYSDPNLGMQERSDFLAAIGAAAARASSGRGIARLRTRTIIS